MLIAHLVILGVHARDLRLRIALPADIAFRTAVLIPADVASGNLKALLPINGIAFRLITRQILRVIGLSVADSIVGQHLLDQIAACRFAGTNLNVIVVALHDTGNGIPLGIGFGFAVRPPTGPQYWLTTSAS